MAALDERRGGHVVRTAEMASGLAGRVEERFRRLGLPPADPVRGVVLASRAYLAGILHDSHRDGAGLTPDYPLDEIEGRYKSKLHHAALAAQFAYDRCLRDRGVLFAVRYHTVGHPSPTPLLCTLMLADAIEPGRTYAGVEELREAALEDPVYALVERLKYTTGFVTDQGLEVHPSALAQIETLQRALERS